MSLHDIQCSGKASSLFTRQKSNKKLARQIFSPIHQIDVEQHEIVNHYKDFKRKRTHGDNNYNRRRRKSSSPAKYLGSHHHRHHKKRLSLITSSREILQMPCFVFPRFGKNFPWRGRQTLCNQNPEHRIESETLQKIRSAVTVSDFHKILEKISTHHHIHQDGNNDCCISNDNRNTLTNPLTCHIEKVEKLTSDRKPVTLGISKNRHHHKQIRKGRARYITTTTTNAKVVGCEHFDDDTENLEWFIELASRCYNEGFKWHMNYLNDCKRRETLLKRRRLSAVSTANRIFQRQCTDKRVLDEHRQRLIGKISNENIRLRDDPAVAAADDDDDANASDCKIRININQSSTSSSSFLNVNSSNTKTINNHHTNNINNISNNNNPRKRSNYSCVAHLNKKINIMNSSGYSIDAIINVHHHQNDMKTDRLNEVLDNFGSLNISCGGSVLPQIVLTDFSSIDSMPRTNTLLLTPSSSSSAFVSSSSSAELCNNLSGIKSSQSLGAECLSIPAEYYRNETRPC